MDRGEEPRGAGSADPAGPRGDELDCLVGGIVVTWQEIASRIKRCEDRQQGSRAGLYPMMRPDSGEQRSRGPGAGYRGGEYPGPQEPRPSARGPAGRGVLESLWSGMARGRPGIMPGAELVGRVEDAHRHRNGVAHGWKARGNTVIRNSRLRETYEKDVLEGYLAHARDTLGHVKQLYDHLSLPPME